MMTHANDIVKCVFESFENRYEELFTEVESEIRKASSEGKNKIVFYVTTRKAPFENHLNNNSGNIFKAILTQKYGYRVEFGSARKLGELCFKISWIDFN